MEHDSCAKGNTKSTPDGELINLEYDDSSFFQPIRVRRGSVLVNSSNWEFMVRECRLVWYSGLLFWSLLILSLAL